MYYTPHWTDNAPRPVFVTAIPIGNINEMLGAASRALREIGVPRDRIDRLRSDVSGAADYDEACAFIEAWFPIDRGDAE